jgi:hypothetical protein
MPRGSKAPEIGRTSPPGKRRLRKICTAGFSGHQDFLIGQVRRRGSLGDKRQLEVVSDAVHHGVIGEESDKLDKAKFYM